MNQAKLLCKWDYVPVGRVVGLNKEYLDLGQIKEYRLSTRPRAKYHPFSPIPTLPISFLSYDQYYFSFFFLLALLFIIGGLGRVCLSVYILPFFQKIVKLIRTVTWLLSKSWQHIPAKQKIGDLQHQLSQKLHFYMVATD